jgi:hypothetical protein
MVYTSGRAAVSSTDRSTACHAEATALGKDPGKPPFVQEISVPSSPVHAGIFPVGGCPVRNVGSVRRSVLAPGLAARDPVVDTGVLVSRVAGPNAPSEIDVIAAPPHDSFDNPDRTK